MTCEECEKFQEENKVYFFRWKIANIGILACRQHATEVMNVLIKYQKEMI